MEAKPGPSVGYAREAVQPLLRGASGPSGGRPLGGDRSVMGKGLCGQSRSGALSHGGVALPSEPGVPHTRGCQEGTLSRSADYRAPRQLSSYQSSFHHEAAWEAVWGTGARGGGGPLCLPATSSPPPALSPIGRRFTGGPRPQPWRLIYAKTCEPCSRRSHSPHQWFLNPPLSVPKLREPGWRGSAQTQDRRPSGGGRTPHSRGPHRGRPEAAPPGGLKTVANPGQEGTFQNGLSKRS